MKLTAVFFLQGLTLLMHKNYEGPAIFEMLNNALEIAQRGKRVTNERNLKFVIAQMHVIKVNCKFLINPICLNLVIHQLWVGVLGCPNGIISFYSVCITLKEQIHLVN
jgi:hypothetical protein